MTPPAAFEAHHALQVRITLQQRGKGGIDPPVDLGVGPVELQQTQDWQRLNDITK
jgi:hypothetical protein